MAKYMKVDPDLDKWQAFVSLAMNEIYTPEQLTVYYDEIATDLPTEMVVTFSDGGSVSTYLSPDTVEDFRRDMHSTNEAYAIANKDWED